MKIPSRWKTTLFALVTGIFLACNLIAKTEDSAGTNSTNEAQGPHLLLADVWNAAIDPSGWWMSEKYDGLRGYWDGGTLWTRRGQAVHAPSYFLAELPRGIALDGELWIGRGKFEETVSTVRAETPDDRWKNVHFMVFDAPQAKGAFEERMQFLHATLPEGNRFVRVVVQVRCQGVKQLLAERDRIVKMGGEGLMLRQPESQYEPRRSPTLLKVKPYDDAEATIISYETGKGKLAGKLGAFRVRAEDGREFSVGSGLTDAQRKSPPPIGTVITYRFRGLTAKGMPRFPTYLRVRQD
ncbi:MAG TPA: DNA ligase [Chthoniobacterales bacterium]|jgi:DNA ligase-1